MKFNFLLLLLFITATISCKETTNNESIDEDKVEIKANENEEKLMQKRDSLITIKEEFEIDDNGKSYLLDQGLNVTGKFKWNTSGLKAHQTKLATITVPEYANISLLNLEYCESKKQLMITYEQVKENQVPVLTLDVVFNEVLSTGKNEKITVFRFDATGAVDLDENACSTTHGHPDKDGIIRIHTHTNGHTRQDSLNIKGVDGIKSTTTHKLQNTGTIIIGKKP
jgi:hypothetical protein